MLDAIKKKLKDSGEAYLRIKVNAGASETRVAGILKDADGDVIKINIAAQPVKGKANQELVRFLVKEFGISKDCVKIISGAGDKFKFVKLKI